MGTKSPSSPNRKTKRKARIPRDDPSRFEDTPPPRGAFAKGALLGFVIGIPAIAATVFGLAHLGYGDDSHGFERTLRFALVFAGLPTTLTAAGVGRIAARAAIAPTRGGTRYGVRTAAITFAVAGAGLVILTAVPLGGLPSESLPWIWLAVAGLGVGAIVGALIGLWAAGVGPSDPDDVNDVTPS